MIARARWPAFSRGPGVRETDLPGRNWLFLCTLEANVEHSALGLTLGLNLGLTFGLTIGLTLGSSLG
jgi:hypothetical protein